MAIDVNGKTDKRKGAQGAQLGAQGVRPAANPEANLVTDEGKGGVRSQVFNGFERENVADNGVLDGGDSKGRSDVGTYQGPERNSISHTLDNTVPKAVYAPSEKETYLEADPNVTKQRSRENGNFSESQRGSRGASAGKKAGTERAKQLGYSGNSISAFLSTLGIQVPTPPKKVAENGSLGPQTASAASGAVTDSKTFSESQNGGRVADAKKKLSAWSTKKGYGKGDQPNVFNGWQTDASGSVVENGTGQGVPAGVAETDADKERKKKMSAKLTNNNREDNNTGVDNKDISTYKSTDTGSNDLKGKEDKKEINKERNEENGKGSEGTAGNGGDNGQEVGGQDGATAPTTPTTTTTANTTAGAGNDVKVGAVADVNPEQVKAGDVKSADVKANDWKALIEEQDKEIKGLMDNPPKLRTITTLADEVRKTQKLKGSSPEQLEEAAKKKAKSNKVKSLITALADIVAHSANMLFTAKGALNTKMGSMYAGWLQRMEKEKSTGSEQLKASLKELADASAKDAAQAQKLYYQELAAYNRTLRDARTNRNMLVRQQQRHTDSVAAAEASATRKKEAAEQQHKYKEAEIKNKANQDRATVRYRAEQSRVTQKQRYDLADRNNANSASRKGNKGKGGSSRPNK